MQPDPIGLDGGFNTYVYALANPIMYIDFLGLEWEYSQSKGSISHDNTLIGTGYAGHGEGVNNPNMQNVENTGPLPRGSYTIGPQLNHMVGKNTLFGSMILTPSRDNQMYRRSGFLIHGPHPNDNMNSSNGCIILNKSIRNQIGNFVNSGDNQLKVIE